MLIPILIYLALPFSGLFLFALLVLKMYNEKISNKPIAELFVVFLSYGGLLVFLLTVLFWHWSALALIGLLYLVFIAPILHIIIIIYLRKELKTSVFHKWIYRSLISYFIIGPSSFYLLFFC
jgi:hypothetical protein